MYRWSKISTAKFIAISTKSMGCFIGKIVPYFIRKCTILNIFFPNFSGGNTPGPPLREGATPSRTHSEHSLRPCAGAQAPPFVVPPMLSTNRRPSSTLPTRSIHYYSILQQSLRYTGYFAYLLARVSNNQNKL